MKKSQVCSEIAFWRKVKTKVETSSLRNLKILPETSLKLYFHDFHLCSPIERGYLHGEGKFLDTSIHSGVSKYSFHIETKCVFSIVNGKVSSVRENLRRCCTHKDKRIENFFIFLIDYEIKKGPEAKAIDPDYGKKLTPA
jgi:hypothetical protein